MPIRVQHGPDAGMLGLAAYYGGLGRSASRFSQNSQPDLTYDEVIAADRARELAALQDAQQYDAVAAQQAASRGPAVAPKNPILDQLAVSEQAERKAIMAAASDPRRPLSPQAADELWKQHTQRYSRLGYISTLPSPLSVYKAASDEESPDVKKGRLSEGLKKFFGSEWDDDLSALIDPNASPKDNMAAVKSLMDTKVNMLKARGESQTAQTDSQKRAMQYELKRHDRRKPKQEEDESEADYTARLDAWEDEESQIMRRYDPAAYQELPSFAEAAGTSPSVDAALDAQAAAAGAQTYRPALEVATRLSSQGFPAVAVQSPDELQRMIRSGDIEPGGVVVVPSGGSVAAYKLQPNGKFVLISAGQ